MAKITVKAHTRQMRAGVIKVRSHSRNIKPRASKPPRPKIAKPRQPRSPQPAHPNTSHLLQKTVQETQRMHRLKHGVNWGTHTPTTPTRKRAALQNKMQQAQRQAEAERVTTHLAKKFVNYHVKQHKINRYRQDPEKYHTKPRPLTVRKRIRATVQSYVQHRFGPKKRKTLYNIAHRRILPSSPLK